MKALPEASALGKRLPRLQLHLCFLGQTVLQLGCSCASVLVVEAFPVSFGLTPVIDSRFVCLSSLYFISELCLGVAALEQLGQASVHHVQLLASSPLPRHLSPSRGARERSRSPLRDSRVAGVFWVGKGLNC
jgi:hypothetical protein